MRREWFKQLYEAMKEDPNIYLVVGDLGYGGVDRIREEFPDRYINAGAAEFSMIGIAIGLALEGKIPICYTITPFYFRAFEIIRTYVDHESIPIIMIGAGRGSDYKDDGFSHYAGDDYILKEFKNIRCYWPEFEWEAKEIFTSALKANKPYYINLRR